MAKKINEFTEDLLKRFKDFESNEGEIDITQTGKALTLCKELIRELKAFANQYQFETTTEEVVFFKTVKPVLLSQYYYHKRKFALQLFDAFRDHKSRIDNYNKLLRKMQSYIKKNQDFYEYCMSGSSYLDNTYFVRTNSNALSIKADDSFATGFDNKLAKFIAIEMTKEYIMHRSKKLQDDGNNTRPGLMWTAQKVDLVELIYALHSLGTFNNASLEIKDIVESFEMLFNVSLGNTYRVFSGVRMRKNNQTVFLDRLKEKLLQRINDMDER